MPEPFPPDMPHVLGKVMLDIRARLIRDEGGRIHMHMQNNLGDCDVALDSFQVLASNLIYLIGKNCSQSWDEVIDAVLRDAVKMRGGST